MSENSENPLISKYLSLGGSPKWMSVRAVIDSTGRIDNDRAIKDFFTNVDLKHPSRIVIEKYTIEGEPTFKIIEFDGKRFKFVDDSSKTIDNRIEVYKGNNYKRKSEEVYEDNFISYDLYKDNKFIVNMIVYKEPRKS